MAYSDYVHNSAKPECWGDHRSYSEDDAECAHCQYRRSCREEVNRTNRVHTTSRSRTNYRANHRRVHEEPGDGEAGVNQPAVVEENERPVERFAKDAIGGGLRGMFYEMWQFWRHYRIR